MHLEVCTAGGHISCLGVSRTPMLLQVRAAKQAVAAGSLSGKNVVQPGKRLPGRGTMSLEDDQQEEEEDEPAGMFLGAIFP